MALAARQIADADGQLGAREHPERYRDPLRCIDASRALLENFGWGEPPRDLHVGELQTHGWALTAALQDQLSVHADMLRDIDRDDEQHETLTRNTHALEALALTVLLRTQAAALRLSRRPGTASFLLLAEVGASAPVAPVPPA